MNKIFMITWAILAILSILDPFIGLPLLMNIVDISFGIINICVIITWAIGYYMLKKENKKFSDLLKDGMQL